MVRRVTGWGVFLILLVASWEAGRLLSGTSLQAQEPAKAHNTDRYGDPLPQGAFARLGTIRLRQELRANDGACSVAFSPDGKTLVSSAGDVVFWDVLTGKEFPWAGPRPTGNSFVFSDDGKTLMSAGSAARVQRWDSRNQKLLRDQALIAKGGTIDVGQGRTFSPSFGELSANGKVFALYSYSDKCALFDIASAKLLGVICDERPWGGFALSPDGTILARCGMKRLGPKPGAQVTLWDVATCKVLRRFPELEDQINWPAFAPDSKVLVTSGRKSLRLWDVATGNLVCEIAGSSGPVAFSRDGRLLACGDAAGIRLWDRTAGKEVRRFGQHVAPVKALAFSPDGKKLASGQDYSLTMWDVTTGKPCHELQGHEGTITCAAYSPRGTYLASGGDEYEPRVIVWDLKARKPILFLPGHHPGAVSAAFSPDEKLLATGEGYALGTSQNEAQIRLWSLPDGRLVRQFTGHLSSVRSLAFSPDGKTLASGGDDARVRLWDLASGKLLKKIRGAEGQRAVSFSPDGNWLLIVEDMGGLAVWQVGSWQKERDLGPPSRKDWAVLPARFLAESKTVVSLEGVTDRVEATPDSPPSPREPGTPLEVRFWGSQAGQLLRSVKIGQREAGTHVAAVSPDGKTLAWYSRDGFREPGIRLWDTAEGKLLGRLCGHTGDVSALVFSPDSKVLASGSDDATLLLWDVARARLYGLWLLLGDDERHADQAGRTLAADPEAVVPFLKERLLQALDQERPYARTLADLDSDQFVVREMATRRLKQAGTRAEGAMRLALIENPSAEAKRRIQQVLGKIMADREERVNQLLAHWEDDRGGEKSSELLAMGREVAPVLRRCLELPPFPRNPGGKCLPPELRWVVQNALAEVTKKNLASTTLNAQGLLRSVRLLQQIGTPAARKVLEELAAAPQDCRIAREAVAARRRLP